MKTAIVGLICLFYCSCTSNKKEETFFLSVTPKESISAVLDSFVKVNPYRSDYFHEIYVDKQSPSDCLLFIYSGNRPLLYRENQKPLMRVMVSGINFDLYSGVERFFEISGDSTLKENSNSVFPEEDHTLWVVTDSAGILKVQDYYHAYPFVPLPGNTEKYFWGSK